MYKHLFFLDSKTLDWLTPYILVLASDTIAFNVFVLTFVSAVVFNFLNPMLAFIVIQGDVDEYKMVCFGKTRVKG